MSHPFALCFGIDLQIYFVCFNFVRIWPFYFNMVFYLSVQFGFILWLYIMAIVAIVNRRTNAIRYFTSETLFETNSLRSKHEMMRFGPSVKCLIVKWQSHVTKLKCNRFQCRFIAINICGFVYRIDQSCFLFLPLIWFRSFV